MRLHGLSLGGAVAKDSGLHAGILRVVLALNAPGKQRPVLVIPQNLQGTLHDLVHAHVVGVTVAAVGVVGDQHIRLNLVNCGDQGLRLRFEGLGGQRGIARDGVGDGLTVRAPGHAGVAVEGRHALGGGRLLTEEEVAVHAQGLESTVQLAHAVLPQRFAIVGASGLTDLQVL